VERSIAREADITVGVREQLKSDSGSGVDYQGQNAVS
jgi:hypothetical protein